MAQKYFVEDLKMTLLKVYFFKTVEIESVVVSAHPLNVKVVSGFGIFIVGYKHNAYILLFECPQLFEETMYIQFNAHSMKSEKMLFLKSADEESHQTTFPMLVVVLLGLF